MRLLIDAHLDIAWNAVCYDRDQLLSIDEMRRNEAGMTAPCRGRSTVSLPEMRRAGVGTCLATLLSRALPKRLPQLDGNLGDQHARKHGETILREDLDYANQTIACAAAQAQLAYYRLLEQQGHLRMVRDTAMLNSVWAQWEQGAPDAPIGFILSMEGTDPIIEPSQAEWWWEQGLRTACLAHYGPSAHAMGTGGDGPLTQAGRDLLKEFENLGMILDLVHTADTALAQALDAFAGPVFISHGNTRSLVPHDRQISDGQIRQIVARNGVIGVVMDAWMIVPNYIRKADEKPMASLTDLADHIDYLCQLAGNAKHVAIGSDLDGGFGTEQTPREINTIYDLHKLEPLLASRGYSDADLDAIFHGNWLRFFREALPKG